MTELAWRRPGLIPATCTLAQVRHLPDTNVSFFHTNVQLVDGDWTEWTPWDDCSKSCGMGQQSRNRTCTNPTPMYGGLNCMGNGTEVMKCHIDKCVVKGEAFHRFLSKGILKLCHVTSSRVSGLVWQLGPNRDLPGEG